MASCLDTYWPVLHARALKIPRDRAHSLLWDPLASWILEKTSQDNADTQPSSPPAEDASVLLSMKERILLHALVYQVCSQSPAYYANGAPFGSGGNASELPPAIYLYVRLHSYVQSYCTEVLSELLKACPDQFLLRAVLVIQRLFTLQTNLMVAIFHPVEDAAAAFSLESLSAMCSGLFHRHVMSEAQPRMMTQLCSRISDARDVVKKKIALEREQSGTIQPISAYSDLNGMFEQLREVYQTVLSLSRAEEFEEHILAYCKRFYHAVRVQTHIPLIVTLKSLHGLWERERIVFDTGLECSASFRSKREKLFGSAVVARNRFELFTLRKKDWLHFLSGDITEWLPVLWDLFHQDETTLPELGGLLHDVVRHQGMQLVLMRQQKHKERSSVKSLPVPAGMKNVAIASPGTSPSQVPIEVVEITTAPNPQRAFGPLLMPITQLKALEHQWGIDVLFCEELLQLFSRWQRILRSPNDFLSLPAVRSSFNKAMLYLLHKDGGQSSNTEMIARYSHALLSGLVSDRHAIEKSRMHTSLLAVVRILPYIPDKDLFRQCCEEFLCARLIGRAERHGVKAFEVERSFCDSLRKQLDSMKGEEATGRLSAEEKQMHGVGGMRYVTSMRSMLDDVEDSEGLRRSFAQFMKDSGGVHSLEEMKGAESDVEAVRPVLQVTVLARGIWPVLKACTVTPPPSMAPLLEQYSEFYKTTNPHADLRVLHFEHRLGSVVMSCGSIIVHGRSIELELMCKPLQAMVLALFDGSTKQSEERPFADASAASGASKSDAKSHSLTVAEIASTLSLDSEDAAAIVHSLCYGLFRPLVHVAGNSSGVGDGDSVEANFDFCNSVSRAVETSAQSTPMAVPSQIRLKLPTPTLPTLGLPPTLLAAPHSSLTASVPWGTLQGVGARASSQPVKHTQKRRTGVPRKMMKNKPHRSLILDAEIVRLLKTRRDDPVMQTRDIVDSILAKLSSWNFERSDVLDRLPHLIELDYIEEVKDEKTAKDVAAKDEDLEQKSFKYVV